MNHHNMHIQHHGATFIRAGLGSTKPAQVFINAATGEHLELFEGVVVQTGPHFDLVTVPGGPAKVRIEKDVLRGKAPAASVGARLLVGPLAWDTHGLRASAAWPLAARPKLPPPVLRRRGVIRSPSGTFARILASDGSSFFVHAKDAPGVPLVPNVPVSFRAAYDDPRGPAAREVRLAA